MELSIVSNTEFFNLIILLRIENFTTHPFQKSIFSVITKNP